eukprot:6516192-Alexandrium_andersonii.AAC.1
MRGLSGVAVGGSAVEDVDPYLDAEDGLGEEHLPESGEYGLLGGHFSEEVPEATDLIGPVPPGP